MSVNLRGDPVKAYLFSVAEAKLDAKRLRLKLQRLEAQVTKVTAQLTGMPDGGARDRELLLAKLADMRVDCELAKIRAEEKEKEVAHFIDKLENPLSRMILKLRYCECLSWVATRKYQRSVQDELIKTAGLEYEDRHLYRLHGRALNEAREIFNKEEHDHDKRRDS